MAKKLTAKEELAIIEYLIDAANRIDIKYADYLAKLLADKRWWVVRNEETRQYNAKWDEGQNCMGRQ